MRTFIEIADDLNDLVTELNDKIVESIKEKNADVATVRHGRWIDRRYGGSKRCSECGYIWTDFGYPNYCPDCGARMMDEEKMK